MFVSLLPGVAGRKFSLWRGHLSRDLNTVRDSPRAIWRKSNPGRGHSTCKGPRAEHPAFWELQGDQLVHSGQWGEGWEVRLEGGSPGPGCHSKEREF